MELKKLARTLVQRWWLLLAGTVFAMGASYLALRFLTPWPRYQATATVMVLDRTGDSDWSSLQVSRALASTYALWATQQPVLQGVIGALDLPLSVPELRQEVAARAIRETELIEISAASRDPQQAADIANELVRQLEAQIAIAVRDETDLSLPSRDEIVELKARIDAADAELTQLTEELARYETVQSVTTEITKLEARIGVAEVELLRLTDALATYKRTLPEVSEIAALEARVSRTEARLTSLTEQLLEDSPTEGTDMLSRQVSALQGNHTLWQGKLDSLYAQARAASEAEISQLVRRINATQSNLEMWQRQVDRLYAREQSASEAELDQLARRIDVLQSNLGLWRAEYNDLWARYANRPVVSLVVVDEAEAPTDAMSAVPNILVAGVSGLVLSIAASILIEVMPALAERESDPSTVPGAKGDTHLRTTPGP